MSELQSTSFLGEKTPEKTWGEKEQMKGSYLDVGVVTLDLRVLYSLNGLPITNLLNQNN